MFSKLKVSKSNQELLLLLREDDRLAFYNIYERYCKKVYGFVLRYIKQETDAEDIVQEVFIKVWENRKKIDVNSSFESFLFAVSYNTTMSLFRKRISEKKYVEYIKLIQLDDNQVDVAEQIIFDELIESIRKVIEELTPRQREIFLLSRKEGLSHEEIAEKLDISVNTVKKHMVNTLSFLKSHLNVSLLAFLLYIFLFF